MTNDTTYNGWTNYATWVVNLWLDNDSYSFDCAEIAAGCVQQAIDDDDTDTKPTAMTAMAARLEEMVDEWQDMAEHKPAGLFADLLGYALGTVDWREIAGHYVDDVRVYCAGWNMPGYMPDAHPALFLNSDDAMAHIKDEMKQHAESLSDGIDPECLSDDTTHIPALIKSLKDCAQSGKADAAGEFGQTFGSYHYFVTLV